MARVYSTQTTGPLATGAAVALGDAALLGGKIHAEVASYTTAALVADDDIVLGKTKPGMVYLGTIVINSATLGASATLSIGIEGSLAKYVAARTFTGTDTPVLCGKASAIGTEETEAKLILATVGTAALAAGVTLRIINLFTWAHGG